MTGPERHDRDADRLRRQGWTIKSTPIYRERYDAYDELDLADYGLGEEGQNEGELVELRFHDAMLLFTKRKPNPSDRQPLFDSGRSAGENVHVKGLDTAPFRQGLREQIQRMNAPGDLLRISWGEGMVEGVNHMFDWPLENIDTFDIYFRCPGPDNGAEHVLEDRWFYDLGRLQQVFWGLIDRYSGGDLVDEAWSSSTARAISCSTQPRSLRPARSATRKAPNEDHDRHRYRKRRLRRR